MPVDPPKGRRLPPMPAGLREAFRHLMGWFEAGDPLYTPKEEQAAVRLKESSDLLPVWNDLESAGVVDLQDWCDLIVRVLLKAYAFPDTWVNEYYLAEQARWNAAAVRAAVTELRAALVYVPDEGEPGYQEEQRKLAESAEVQSVLERLECTFPEVPDISGSEPVIARRDHTRFMHSICATWREEQMGEQPHLPNLKAAHLAALVQVLFPNDVENIDIDELTRVARQVVGNYRA